MNKDPDVDWFTKVSPVMAVGYRRLVDISHDLRARIPDPFPLSSVFNQQFNSYNDYLRSTGNIATDKAGGISINPEAVSKEMARASLFTSFGARLILDQFTVRTLMAIVTIQESLSDNLSRKRLGPAMSDLRATIEHAAHYDFALQKCLTHPVPPVGDSTKAATYLEEIRETLAKGSFSTRFDWKSLFTDGVPLRERKDTKFRPSEDRMDMTAESILKAVDKLAKRVSGARNVYEFLCEFAHPNIGTGFAFNHRSRGPFKDDKGLYWKEVIYSRAGPDALLEIAGPVLAEVLNCVAECLETVRYASSTVEEIGKRVSAAARSLIKGVIKHNRALLDPYEPCPCYSGKKLKFCCMCSD